MPLVASRSSASRIVDVLADEDRRVALGVARRLALAEREHQVHEVGRLVALEHRHELLVVDPERVGRVVVDRLEVLRLDHVRVDALVQVQDRGDVAHHVLDELGIVVGALGDELLVRALEQAVELAGGLTSRSVVRCLLSRRSRWSSP